MERSATHSGIDVARAAQRVRRLQHEQDLERAELYAGAQIDLERAIEVARAFPQVRRIRVWGSLLRPDRFTEMSELIGEIDGHAAVTEELLAAAQTLVTDDIPRIGRNTTTSVAAAGLIENYYTALETVLFRVSQNFGNNLDGERWHSDLLRRMTIAVPDVRPAVVSKETHEMLDELMRFRHFRRYYFHLRYDWHRLEYLLGLIGRVEPLIRAELSVFRRFLVDLVSAIAEP